MPTEAIFCNKCGAQNTPSAQFCSGCGAALATGLRAENPVGSSPASLAPAPHAYSSGITARAGYGGFWVRFVAALIDGILVQAVIMPVAFVVGGIAGIAGTTIGGLAHGFSFAGFIVSGVLGLFANWIYEAAMESSSRQATLGKMIFGMKVTDMQGSRISFARATGRHFAKFLSSMILMVGYIMAGFTAQKQALHDMIAGTLVRRG